MFTITKESKRSQKMLTVLTVNQRVVGSSPTGGALKIKGLQQLQPFFNLLFRHISDTCPV